MQSMVDFSVVAGELNVFGKGTKRAPHKPLLLLTALARFQQEGRAGAHAHFTLWEQALKPLLVEYAPSGQANTHYPFRRLPGDGLWWIEDLPSLPDDAFVKGSGDTRGFRISWLRRHDVRGGLPDELLNELERRPLLLDQMVRVLLHVHFPPSMWQEILDEVRIDHDLSALFPLPRLRMASGGPRRSARFAQDVRALDGNRCTVCPYDGWDDDAVGGKRPVAQEAAHVRWHTHGGTCDVSNGVLMCSLHHRLFDRGMFVFDPTTREVRVSPRMRLTEPNRFNPSGSAPARLARENLEWHMENVYRAS